MSAAVKLWWVSWEERDSAADPRPLRFPPGPGVIGHWCAGRGEESAAMVALVVAENEEAIEAVIAPDWPSKRPRVWRFRNPRDERPLNVGDRFPFRDWSLERLKALGVAHDVEVQS